VNAASRSASAAAGNVVRSRFAGTRRPAVAPALFYLFIMVSTLLGIVALVTRPSSSTGCRTSTAC